MFCDFDDSPGSAITRRPHKLGFVSFLAPVFWVRLPTSAATGHRQRRPGRGGALRAPGGPSGPSGPSGRLSFGGQRFKSPLCLRFFRDLRPAGYHEPWLVRARAPMSVNSYAEGAVR